MAGPSSYENPVYSGYSDPRFYRSQNIGPYDPLLLQSPYQIN